MDRFLFFELFFFFSGVVFVYIASSYSKSISFGYSFIGDYYFFTAEGLFFGSSLSVSHWLSVGQATVGRGFFFKVDSFFAFFEDFFSFFDFRFEELFFYYGEDLVKTEAFIDIGVSKPTRGLGYISSSTSLSDSGVFKSFLPISSRNSCSSKSKGDGDFDCNLG